jgi:predicted Zn-dependent protease
MKVIRLLAVTVLLMIAPLLAERTKLKPGFNLFSADQDVQIGREVSKDAERQLKILNNRDVSGYLSTLGRRLSSNAPGERYPYEFKVIDDKAINAFALPGGFLYINRGIFETADTEAQLAGVVAHEIAHVSLRHGTNQMSKAQAAQAPLALLGGLVGGDSIGGVLAQLGASFAANSVLLKFSRDGERQADLMGAQILYDSNYDPRAMSQFFQKLEGSSGSRGSEFFSSHPNPGNRAGSVAEEVRKLGGARNFRNDSADFQRIKRILKSK